MIDRTPTRLIVPDFAPVPRKYRHDGWTPERQRAFIDALADTGSVKHAAKRINMSPEGAYFLRRQPGAEGFRRAWEAALDHGVQTLADLAFDRAREGVAIPIFHQGEQVGERRHYNERLTMFLLRHHLPHRYGALKPLAPGTKHPDTIAWEAADRQTAGMAKVESWLHDRAQCLGRLAWLHRRKVYAAAEALVAGDGVAAGMLTDQARRLEQAMDGDPKLWSIWSAILPALDKEAPDAPRDWELDE
ncbi:MAG: hypothetical protein JWM75_1458 [Sphingomonas bacterium]|jgi:hypothetical protein|nr:hypothetical protein [Sphingomonas bacterium]